MVKRKTLRGRLKKKLVFDNVEFDSNEEIWFYQWCIEAKKANIISSFKRTTESYELSPRQSESRTEQLKTKTKTVEKFLLHPHNYTPDFEIVPGINFNMVSKYFYIAGYQQKAVIDVKAGFSLYNNHREFSVNRKWMYDKYKIYVNQIDPVKLFKGTFVPLNVACGKRKQRLKKFANCKMLNEII